LPARPRGGGLRRRRRGQAGGGARGGPDRHGAAEGSGRPGQLAPHSLWELGPKAGTAACRQLAGLTPAQLKPVPANVACTEIYGGPATARVRGELNGKQVDARFELTNGCEIERWDRNRVLLDDAPAGG
jgi:hypothetical protein